MFQRLLIFFISLAFIVMAYSQPVKAASNFTTDYHITYNAIDDQLTKVVVIVTLTNTTSQFYASSYQMNLGFSDISNLSASDEEGVLKPIVKRTEDGHLLDITFNKKAVGKGDKLTFRLNFDTKEVTRKHGKIWEINVPGLANPEEFQSFRVEVKVPPSFGTPTYIKPTQPQKSLTFTKEQLGKSGISIAFGDAQFYAFDLAYHLQNKNLFPIKSEIALPPTTNYQDVYISGMEPPPANVRADKDGNWIAEYNLLPAQKLDVTVRGNAAIKLTPRQEELSLEDYALYTKAMTYWEATDPEIMKLAQTYTTPKAIYEYVITTLKYDFKRVTEDSTRLGAAIALRTPNAAVCREFTDLFIAISRAAGIPAREVNGFAYTQNPRQRPISVTQDVLHSWPEYYNKEKKTWVMVDPTWGSTTGGVDYFDTLDNDHVAFVKKGVDSKEPLPAGAYKLTSGSGLKDVTIGFADSIPHRDSDVSFTPQFPSVAVAGLPIKGTVTVKNTGSGMVRSQIFTVNSKNLIPSDQVFQFPDIPPFGSVTIPVTFKPTSLLTNLDAGLTIRYTPLGRETTSGKSVLGASTSDQNQSVAQHSLKVAPFYQTVWGIGGGLAVFTIIILITATKSRRLRLSR